MRYIISSVDESFYIGVDKNDVYTKVTDRNKAKEFLDEKKATNVINNNLKGILSLDSYKIFKIFAKDDAPMIDRIETDGTRKIKNCDNTPIKYDLKSLAFSLSLLPSEIENERIRLNNILIRLCRAITDISHYQEFNGKRSASKRCILEKLESNILVKRRKIKNDLEYLDIIEERLNGKVINLTEMENKTYRPREFQLLFEENEIPEFDIWWDEINEY